MRAPTIYAASARGAAIAVSVRRRGRGRVNRARRVEVHGHRGARAVYPENTLPGFQYAIDCGVDVLELDLAVTRDGVLVVSHDPAMNPVFCDGPAGTRGIREMTLAQVREWDCGARANPAFPGQRAVSGTRVPMFDEVLALGSGVDGLEFNVETKIFADRPELTPGPEEFARLVFEAAAKHQVLDRLILQSFDFRTLEAMRRIDGRVRLSALFDRGEIGIVQRARAVGASIVSPHLSLVDHAMVDHAREKGMHVVPWTANTVEQWDRLLEAGVDGIITDDPAALIAHLNRA
jgi:glycerophosphoryl diester phosphodiesterase